MIAIFTCSIFLCIVLICDSVLVFIFLCWKYVSHKYLQIMKPEMQTIFGDFGFEERNDQKLLMYFICDDFIFLCYPQRILFF